MATMFNRIVVYIRKKRSRAQARPSAQEASLQAASAEHLQRRRNIPHDDTVVTGDHPNHLCHDAAAHDKDKPSHTQDVIALQVSTSDAIVDSLSVGNTRSSFAPINKLPSELLVHIFLYTRLGYWSSDFRPVEPIRHMLVCRRWRDIVVDHVCFWRTIDVKNSAEWPKLALSRSHQAALHLRVHNLTTFTSVFPDLKPHRPRIRILEITSFRCDEEIRTLCRLLFSRLNSLTRLEIWYSSGVRTPVLPIERYPQLMQLEITGIYIQWTVPLLSRLTILSLNNCAIWPSRMDMDTFLDVLQCGQRLQQLTLRNFMTEACSDTPPRRDRHPFALPNLLELDVTDTVLKVRQFAAFLQFPTHSDVKFTGTLGMSDLDNNPLDPCELLLSHRLCDIPFVRSTAALSLTQSVDSCGVRWLDDRRLLLDFPEKTVIQDAHIISRMIEETFSSTTITTLSLDIDLLHVSRAVFDAIFDALPHLRYLFLDLSRAREGDTPLSARVLESLASIPDMADADTTGAHVHVGKSPEPEQAEVVVRCPELQYVNVDGFHRDSGEIMAAILRCLIAREGRGAQKLGSLDISVKPPRAPGEDERAQLYAARLRELVSRGYKFTVRN